MRGHAMLVTKVPRLAARLGLAAALAGCAGDGSPTSPAEVLLLASKNAAPAAPSNISAVASAPGQIDVAWTDNSSNEDGFEVYGSSTGPTGTFAPYTETGPNVTTATFSGYGFSQTYCHKVRGFNAVGKQKRNYSAFTSVACATTLPPPPPPPNPPSGTIAKPVNSSTIVISWTDNSDNEDGFRVYRSVSNSANWQEAGTTAANVTSFTDGSRVADQIVYYHVTAYRGSSASAPSPDVYTAAPAAPTNLVATAVNHLAIDLAWTDNSGIEDRQEVQRATAAGGPYEQLALVGPAVTQYRDGGLPSSTTYWYRVAAVRSDGHSDFTNEASATTAPTPAPSKPAEPTDVSADVASSNVTLLYWTDNSYNELGFRIEVTIDGVPFGPVGTAEPDATSGYVYDQPSEKQLCYQVIAHNELGESPSNTTSTNCTTLPAAPTDAAVTDGGLFTWKDNSNVEWDYEVWYCSEWECGAIAWLEPNTESYQDDYYQPWFTYYIVAYSDGGYSDFTIVAQGGSGATPAGASTARVRAIATCASASRSLVTGGRGSALTTASCPRGGTPRPLGGRSK